MGIETGGFMSPTLGEVETGRVIEEIAKFVKADSDSYYTVVIGTDSQAKVIEGKNHVDYVTAIIVHREGHGARYFWRKERVMQKPVLRDKIYRETLMSITTASEMVPELRLAISAAKYDFEIHVDVGTVGPTRDMIKEVTGIVRANGFAVKTKPESWGASSVADKHT
jgi:predicted RNase H-related nuclease YkuK (DUF458 family)